MATKIKMMKFLTEMDANKEIDRVPPRPALFMMHLRTRSFQPALTKRRLPIRIYPGDTAQREQVKRRRYGYLGGQRARRTPS